MHYLGMDAIRECYSEAGCGSQPEGRYDLIAREGKHRGEADHVLREAHQLES
jgi:hypothetical protein